MRTVSGILIVVLGLLALALAALVAAPRPASTQQLPEPTDHAHLSPCFSIQPLAPGGTPPTAPADLSGAPLPQGAPNAPGVALSWQPVPNADCVGIEEQGPGIPSWTATTFVTEPVSQTAITAPLPGTYCFRAFAANAAGRSGYSNEVCVDVPGVELTFAQGWNLVGGMGGVGAALPGADALYSYDAAQHGYVAIPPSTPLRAGAGYWAYFDAPTTATVSASLQLPVSVTAAAGTWTLIGNPSAIASATVSGADAVFIYDPQSGYRATFTLGPGQGAIAYAASDTTITISPADR